MIGLIDSWDVEYNGTENEALFKLVCDSAAELSSLTHYDNIKIRIGSECTDIATGDKYLKSSSAWILQPQSMFANVYTKAEVDSMYSTLYQTMLYYHTTQTSTDGTITFYAFVGFVGSLTIYGNGQQTGTPSPDNIIMPTFCGVRTGNLFYSDRTMQNKTALSTIDQTDGSSEFVISKSKTSSAVALQVTINLPLRAGTYTVSVDGLSVIAGNLDRISLRDSGGVVVNNVMTGSPQTFTIDTDTVVTAVAFICDSTSTYTNKKVRIMLNSGTTALPYEPYGYKIPITCAGQTTNIYLDDPLRKAIDGSDAVDVMSNDGTITRDVDADGNALATPTTETIDFPAIPITDGENTLTVDTTLPPSKIEISGGRGKKL